jgi:hypothetical protein
MKPRTRADLARERRAHVHIRHEHAVQPTHDQHVGHDVAGDVLGVLGAQQAAHGDGVGVADELRIREFIQQPVEECLDGRPGAVRVNPRLAQHTLHIVIRQIALKRRHHTRLIHPHHLIGPQCAQVRAAGLDPERAVADAGAGVALADDDVVAMFRAEIMGKRDQFVAQVLVCE